jgi:hypothetical protein
LSVTDETVSFSLEINTEEAMVELRKVQTAIFRVLGLLRKHFGDDDFDAIMNNLMKLLTLVNQIRLAVIALEIASGPVGWLLAGVGALTVVSTASDLWGPRY